MLEQGVDRKHGVVRLDNRRGDLRARPHRERDLRLLAVVHGEALKHEAGQAGAGAAAHGVVDHEALQARAVVRELADAVQDQVHDLLADGVVAAREVVRGVLWVAVALLA